jgi:putative phage-type endonuclease
MGHLIEPLKAGSDEWMRVMSASKVAAVLGLSPYESRYSLWHRMKGLVPRQETTAEMARGHYLEPAIANWFADQHPELAVLPGGCWAHDEIPWLTASPDRCLAGRNDPKPAAVLEIKADDSYGWGKAGTDDIPLHYRAQVQVQMHIVGVTRAYVVNLGAYLRFAEYVIDYDPAEAEYVVDQCAAFMDSLTDGPAPDLDAHGATYEVVRKQHPDIDDEDVDLDPEIGAEYIAAYLNAKAADDRWQEATTRVAAALGNARKARHAGQVIAYRKRNGNKTPYLCPAPAIKPPKEPAA